MDRLTDKDLNYVAEPPFFVQMGAPYIDELNGENLGFDADLLVLADEIANEPAIGSVMDAVLLSMDFNPGDFQAQNYDPINADWANFAPGYDAALSTNESNLANDPTAGGGAPQPTQPPTGGGGGGGGGGGNPPPTCDQSAFPNVKCNEFRTFPNVTFGAKTPEPWYISSDQRVTTAKLLSGDPAVWSLKIVDDKEGKGPYGDGPLHQIILSAVGGKRGVFGAVVQWSVKGYRDNWISCACVQVI